MLIPLRQAEHARCGGKAAGLRALLDAGVAVPDGYCLDTSVYRATLPATLPDRRTALREAAAACSALLATLAAWEPTSPLRRALARVCDQLGPRLAVRSSASCEDRAGQSAAGLFETTLGVTELPALLAAVRASWGSLWQPAAWAALRARGGSPHDEAMAVVIQRQLRALHSGFAASHDAAAADHCRVEATSGPPGALALGTAVPVVLLWPRAGRGKVGGAARALGLAARTLDRLRDALLRAEQALGGPVEVEWIEDGEALWLVQARRAPPALVTGREEARWVGTPEGAAQDDALWRWDREHNPEPLSAAHASLVSWLDRELGGAQRFSVREGFLFTAVRQRRPTRAPRSTRAVEPGALRRALAILERSAATIPRAVESAAPPRSTEPPPAAVALDGLRGALTAFAAFYRLYEGRPATLRRQALGALEQALGACGVSGPEERATLLSLGAQHQAWQHSAALWRLTEAARADPALRAWIADSEGTAIPAALTLYLQEHGLLAARWDVAEPTFAEAPALLRAELRARLADAAAKDPRVLLTVQRKAREAELGALLSELPAAQRTRLEPQIAAARLARASAEDDDWLFARALWPLRAAWLRAGAALVARGVLTAPEQVFELPLERLLAALADGIPSAALRAEAEAGATLRRSRGRLLPPLAICAGHCHWGVPATYGSALRGIGCGGTGQGPARVLRDPTTLLTEDLRGVVLICPLLTPALAPVLAQLAGLVTDHGGRLSHAALLAREQGLPAVVGARHATATLHDGEWVWLDGERGLVVRLEAPPAVTAGEG